VSVKDGGEPLGIQAAFTAVSQGKKTLISNGTISCSMISFGDFEKKILNELFKHFLQTSNSIEMLVKETPTNYRIRKILKEFKFRIKKQYKNKYRFYLNKKDFKEQNVPWIKLEKKGKVSYRYFGVPPIKSYFLKHEWNKVKWQSKVVVLGVGQGETLGIDLMRKFIKHLKSLKAKYLPIDLENYGNNIVANAENLHKIFKDESVDYILCNELLEHTEHYWEVINEMLRILRIKGRIFFSVPYNYPPHEYPIDKWRLSYPYLKKVFGKFCKIERVELVGNRNKPRHIIMSLVKTKKFDHPIKTFEGKVDWETGLIYI
jgi:SAM-dependent methyltransferase